MQSFHFGQYYLTGFLSGYYWIWELLTGILDWIDQIRLLLTCMPAAWHIQLILNAWEYGISLGQHCQITRLENPWISSSNVCMNPVLQSITFYWEWLWYSVLVLYPKLVESGFETVQQGFGTYVHSIEYLYILQFSLILGSFYNILHIFSHHLLKYHKIQLSTTWSICLRPKRSDQTRWPNG